jgi:4-diphosphocytidyl-2-C-methyl-D-erythritol kinase
MISFPPCKINLGLNVLSKRVDGYHNLETCFYPIPLTDILEIIPSKQLSFIPSGTAIPGESSDNLCLRAYSLLKQTFDIPTIDIHLHKVIPTGAGLGGGSADAAYTLRLLNDLFALHLSAEELSHFAQQLGSDCSFFVQDEAMLGTGRGEVLESIHFSLSGKYLVLVKPAVHVSTAEAYRGVVPQAAKHSVKSILESTPLHDWKGVLKNDFEVSVFNSHPVIKYYKEKLYDLGAVYASMSGSGSSIFGIFDEPVEYKDEALIWSGVLTR